MPEAFYCSNKVVMETMYNACVPSFISVGTIDNKFEE